MDFCRIGFAFLFQRNKFLGVFDNAESEFDMVVEMLVFAWIYHENMHF